MFSETRPAPVLLAQLPPDRTPLHRTGYERHSPSRRDPEARFRKRAAESGVSLGDGGVHLVDFDELRFRRPPCSFRVLLKLRVVEHLLKVISRLPHIDYHNAIVGSRTGV